jgi:hypothetical protein
MLYRKPLVIDLCSTARASGFKPLCFSGNAASGSGEICYAGQSPFSTHCLVGESGWANCIGGGAPATGADCYPGGTPYWCAGGGAGSVDPYNCVIGPEADIHS